MLWLWKKQSFYQSMDRRPYVTSMLAFAVLFCGWALSGIVSEYAIDAFRLSRFFMIFYFIGAAASAVPFAYFVIYLAGRR